MGDTFVVVFAATTSTGCVLGGSALPDRGESEAVCLRAGIGAFLDTLSSGACVDEHGADQWLVWACFASGPSCVLCPHPLSLHATTAISLCESLAGARVVVEPQDDGKTARVTLHPASES
jgi:RNA 3'-terminal phosphate cyclase (ATP)